MSTPSDPTDPDYGRTPPPIPPYEPPSGQATWRDQPIPPPYEPSPPPPSYGQPPPPGRSPAPAQQPPSGPYDALQDGPNPWQAGENVWQQPSYAQAPQWQASYGQPSPHGYDVTASKGSRLGGYLIDLLVLAIPSSVFSVLASMSGVYSPDTLAAPGQTAGALALLVYYVVLPMIGLAYFGYFGGVKGATIGQRAVGIKVVGVRSGTPIGFWWYVWRMIVLDVTGAFCTLGYWSIFFDSSGRDRGWHDMAGRSRVIRA